MKIAGIDEVGRGSLAGPVVSCAVILPDGYKHPILNDSKKLSKKKRILVSADVMRDAVWSIGYATVEEIEEHNIQIATFMSMHRAIDGLKSIPDKLLIDGNVFNGYKNIPHECVIKGDQKHPCISAASVIAKVWRDNFMSEHEKAHIYGWAKNSGYGTKEHKRSLEMNGECSMHRPSFLRSFMQRKLT